MFIFKVQEGDIEFDAVGRPVVVSGGGKLVQLINAKLRLDVDHRGFGASLGKTGFDVVAEIYDGFARWKKLQDKSIYERDKTALFKEIVSLDVLERKGTKVRFRLVVKSQANENIEMVEEVI